MRLRPRAAGLLLAAWLAAPPGVADDARPPVEDLVPRGPTVEERLEEIRRLIQAVASYPPVARQRAVSGETLIEFTVDPDGEPREIRTVRSSGSTQLDRAAERAARDAAPLPHIYGPVSVPVRFTLVDP